MHCAPLYHSMSHIPIPTARFITHLLEKKKNKFKVATLTLLIYEIAEEMCLGGRQGTTMSLIGFQFKIISM